MHVSAHSVMEDVLCGRDKNRSSLCLYLGQPTFIDIKPVHPLLVFESRRQRNIQPYDIISLAQCTCCRGKGLQIHPVWPWLDLTRQNVATPVLFLVGVKVKDLCHIAAVTFKITDPYPITTTTIYVTENSIMPPFKMFKFLLADQM